MSVLTIKNLCTEATLFSANESSHPQPLLYGVTDGKAIGTYLEQKFKLYLIDRTANLNIMHTVYISAERTADFQMTRGLLNILANEGNKDDLIAFMLDRNLPVDEIELSNIADEILVNPPLQVILTISNALQWRLQ
jgi:hypothetical protein